MAAEPERYELHHEDETHLETNPYLCRTWHRRGHQPTLPAAGTNRRLTDFGSVEIFGRGRVEVLCAQQDSAAFLLYLQALDARHAATGRAVFLVLDNSPCHCSATSCAAPAARQAWLHVSGHHTEPPALLTTRQAGRVRGVRTMILRQDLRLLQACVRFHAEALTDTGVRCRLHELWPR